MIKFIFIFLFLMMPLPATATYLGDLLFLPPHADYQRMNTEHFTIVYPKTLETEAQNSAYFLEQAHSVLSKAFQYEASRLVTIVLTDNEDFANGVTSVFGHQGIILFLVGRDPYTSLGDYDHWLRDLIIHEYTHYLTLDQTRGIFSVTRFVFGDLILPNQFWPAWLSEGMAVYAETKFAERGRGHAPYYDTLTRDGLIRGTLGESEFLHFDQLNGPRSDFPFGEAQYYAGYAIIDEMTQELGENAASRYAEESSWRIPFFLNGGLENIGGTSFRSLWKNWISRQEKNLKPELDWIKAHGTPEPEFLTPPHVTALGARLSPQEDIVAYFLQSGHERPSLHLIDLKTKKDQSIDDALSGAGLAWNHDGTELFYAKTDFRGPYSFESDLFVYDRQSHFIERLTNGERAKDPDYCHPSILVYTTHQGRFSELKTLNIKTHETHSVYIAPEYHVITNPRCTADGQTILFSEHDTQPLERVYSVLLQGGKPQYLFGGPAQDGQSGFGARFPDPAQDGKVYFTQVSDHSFDLARWDPSTHQVEQLARSSGGYWLPRVVKNKMMVSYLSSTGIRAGLMDLKKPVLLPADQVSAIEKEIPTSTLTNPSSNYNLLTSLVPRIYSPYLYLAPGQYQAGFSLVGWDDTDQLEYFFAPWYDSVSKRPEGLFSTFHRLATFRLGVNASSEVTSSLTDASQRAFVEERKISLLLSRPFPGVFSTVTPGVIAEWARDFLGGDFGKSFGSPNYRLGPTISWDTRQTYAYSVVPERGFLAYATGLRYFAGPFHAMKGLIGWNQYVEGFSQDSSLSLKTYIAASPQPTGSISQSIVQVGGKGSLGDLNPPLRGYPQGAILTKQANILQAEYVMPIAQVFRGYDTLPFFLRNVGVFTFYDGAKVQVAEGKYSELISGAGGGFLMNTVLAYAAPVRIRLEFAHGFQKNYSGTNTITFYLGF